MTAAADTARARTIADSAARRSGVEISDTGTLDEIREAIGVFDEVWHPDPTNPPMTAEVLRALTHAGSYSTLARDDAGALGFCLAFPSLLPPNSLHSHIAGVVPRGAGRHIGFALKLDQRAWALERGIGTITWTYDPLILRNAWFNAGKLGAFPHEYLVDFYGEMPDAVNAGHGSDRLVVGWELDSPAVAQTLDGAPGVVDTVAGLVDAGAAVALTDAEGGPRTARVGAAERVLVAVPQDIETLRSTDPDRARGWRSAVRDQLGGRLAEGWRVTGVLRSGWYVVDRNPA